MDLEKLNNYVQIALWIGSAIVWGRKMLRDKKLRIPEIPFSTKAIFIAIGIGLLISSTSLYFSYRPRIVEKTVVQAAQQPSKPRILLAWGTIDKPKACSDMLDVSSLMQYEEKYGVAVVCALMDPTVDKFEDQRITVSALRTIAIGPIEITTPLSKPMSDELKQLNAAGVKQFSEWHEVVLLPKGTPVSEIRKLSDVRRYQGKILTYDPY